VEKTKAVDNEGTGVSDLSFWSS